VHGGTFKGREVESLTDGEWSQVRAFLVGS